MAAATTTVGSEGLVRYYDDGAGWPNATVEKERAFREGFLDAARSVVRRWARPSKPGMKSHISFDTEIEAARKVRERIHDQYSVYRAGGEGPRTHHLGYRRGHEAPAARARGRHHALEYVIEPRHVADTAHIDVFDIKLLQPWLAAVEQWARSPMRPEAPMPPPRLLEVKPAPPAKGPGAGLITIGPNMEKPTLACLMCGFDYIHPVAVECRSPGQANGRVRIDSHGVYMDPMVPPDGRGVVVSMTFHCENGHVFTYRLTFHKGMTFVERSMAETPREAGPWPETIWRN